MRVLEGCLEIKDDAYYIFELGGDGGSKVYLADQLLLGNHYEPGYGETFMVPLQKRFYPFRIDYLHNKEGSDLVSVYLKPPGVEDFPISPHTEYSQYQCHATTKPADAVFALRNAFAALVSAVLVQDQLRSFSFVVGEESNLRIDDLQEIVAIALGNISNFGWSVAWPNRRSPSRVFGTSSYFPM